MGVPWAALCGGALSPRVMVGPAAKATEPDERLTPEEVPVRPIQRRKP